MSTKQEEKKPVQQLFKPDTKFEIDINQMGMLEAALKPFEWMASILRNAKNEAANTGAVVPVYEEDIQKEADGKFKLDPNGNPLLIDGFWEKHSNKKEDKTIDLAN